MSCIKVNVRTWTSVRTETKTVNGEEQTTYVVEVHTEVETVVDKAALAKKMVKELQKKLEEGVAAEQVERMLQEIHALVGEIEGIDQALGAQLQVFLDGAVSVFEAGDLEALMGALEELARAFESVEHQLGALDQFDDEYGGRGLTARPDLDALVSAADLDLGYVEQVIRENAVGGGEYFAELLAAAADAFGGPDAIPAEVAEAFVAELAALYEHQSFDGKDAVFIATQVVDTVAAKLGLPKPDVSLIGGGRGSRTFADAQVASLFDPDFIVENTYFILEEAYRPGTIGDLALEDGVVNNCLEACVAVAEKYPGRLQVVLVEDPRDETEHAFVIDQTTNECFDPTTGEVFENIEDALGDRYVRMTGEGEPIAPIDAGTLRALASGEVTFEAAGLAPGLARVRFADAPVAATPAGGASGPELDLETLENVVAGPFDPESPAFTLVELFGTLPPAGGLLGSEPMTLDGVYRAVLDGRISIENIRSTIEEALEHWRFLSEATMHDFATGFWQEAAVSVGWLVTGGLVDAIRGGSGDPLVALNAFSSKVVGGLEHSLDLLDRSDASLISRDPSGLQEAFEAAEALFHASTVIGSAEAFGRVLVDDASGNYLDEYYANVHVGREIVETVTLWTVVGLSTPLGPGAIGVGAAWNMALGSLFDKLENEAFYGEAIPDQEQYIRDLVADALEGGLVGATPMLGKAAAQAMGKVFSANISNPMFVRLLGSRTLPPSVSRFLANRAGGVIASAPLSAANIAADLIRNGHWPSGDEWGDLAARFIAGSLSGAVGQPGRPLTSGHPLLVALTNAGREGAQEVLQDIAAAAMPGGDPLTALTASDLAVTFFASSLIGLLTPGGAGDYDAIGQQFQEQVARQRETIVAELEARGVDPGTITAFEVKHAMIAAAHVADPNVELNTSQIDALDAAARFFGREVDAGLLRPEVLGVAMNMLASRYGSVGAENVGHLKLVWEQVQNADYSGLELPLTTVTPEEFMFLSTIGTDALLKGIMPDGQADAELALVGPGQTLTGGDVAAAMNIAGIPPFLIGTATHGIPGQSMVGPFTLGMTEVEAQLLYESILGHHPSGFVANLLSQTNVMPDFAAMAKTGLIRPEAVGPLSALYEAAIDLSGRWRPVLDEALGREPPGLTMEEYEAYVADATLFASAIEALPEHMSVQLLSDDVAQFSDPAGLPKWFGIGQFSLGEDRTLGNLIRQGVIGPGNGYYWENVARGTGPQIEAGWADTFENLGIEFTKTVEGTPVIAFAEPGTPPHEALAAGIRRSPELMARLDVSPGATDEEIVDAFKSAPIGEDLGADIALLTSLGAD